MIYIFWTCASKEEAKKVIHGLLNQRLIACASILPGIESIYRWKGKIEESDETKVIIKSVPKHFENIRNYIEAHCSYEVPEILQLEIDHGSLRYISWVSGETS